MLVVVEQPTPMPANEVGCSTTTEQLKKDQKGYFYF
jgi:hypothetical protein